MTQEEIQEAEAKKTLFASDGTNDTKAARVRAFDNLRAKNVPIDQALKAALQIVHVKSK